MDFGQCAPIVKERLKNTSASERGDMDQLSLDSVSV